MSIKPLDMQVNIGHINQVAQQQDSAQKLPALQQQQHAANLLKDAERVQDTVVKTAPDHPGQGVRDALAREDQDGRGRKRDGKKRRGGAGDTQPEHEPVFRPDEDKGGLIDIRR
jgi:hypothetical protein